MQTKDRQKMCSSCDGRIPIDAQVCPYCTAGQGNSSLASDASEMHHRSLQDSLTALYAPPYAAKNSHPTGEKKEFTSSYKQEPLKDPMAEKRFHNASASLGVPTIPVDTAEESQVDGGKSSFWPILLLSIGGNLLTLGLLQLFFSDNGFLRLEWDSHYWFVYCLSALPLFFLGFKKANLLK